MKKFTIIKLQLIISCLVISFFIADDLSAQNNITLKDAFKNHFLIGAALNPSHFYETNSLTASLVEEHFNTVTSENVLKWEWVHPDPDKYAFDSSDMFVEYSEKKGMFIVGHTLVWHNQTPEWVFKDSDGNDLTREKLLGRMKDHIHTVVGRYKGRINGWDVVNEALNEDGTLRESEWFNIIGKDYIIKAFQYAHEADPEAELYYNDFSLENEPKRNGAIKLIKELKLAGVRIDGVGLQGHYKMDWPSQSQIDSTIKAFADLDLTVMVTELDVDVLPYEGLNYTAEVSLSAEMEEHLNPYKNGLPESVQQELSNRYGELFEIFSANKGNLNRVTFWGVTDKDSWLNNWPIEGRTNYPLLFDVNGNTKPAFDEVIKKAVMRNF